MKKEVFKIGFINYLNDYTELDFFVKLALNLDYMICQNTDLYIASSAELRDDVVYLFDKFHKVYFYKDYKNDEFQEIIKTIDLGIVPSTLKDTMSQSSIEFLKNDVPILCGITGDGYELSKSELFRFENQEEFCDKFTALYNNPELLGEYKKNYSDVTEEFISESEGL